MSPIVAGQFESLANAEEAARSLYARGMQAMANGQEPDPAQKDEHPQGGRHKVSTPVADEATDTESTGNEDPGSELEHYVEEQRSSKN